MKKILLCICALCIILSSCKKEEDPQITLTLKNLSTLLGKTPDYIKDASPGVLDEEDDEYLGFFIGNDLDGINVAAIFYHFENEKCDNIVILSNDTDNLIHAKNMMLLTEEELEDGSYYMTYTDSSSTSREEEFDSFSEQWEFINTNDIVVANIDEILALYIYKEFYFISGGTYLEDMDYFMSMIEIGYLKDLLKKSTKSFLKSFFILKNSHPDFPNKSDDHRTI
jgi:hypothetical protein